MITPKPAMITSKQNMIDPNTTMIVIKIDKFDTTTNKIHADKINIYHNTGMINTNNNKAYSKATKTRAKTDKTFANKNKGLKTKNKAVPSSPPIPSLSGTFAAHTGDPQKPKAAKEPASPSHATAPKNGSTSIEKIAYI